MSPDDLRMAIERPALQAGLVMEPGLADLLLSEVEGEPGALPLLSHALRETWMRREGRTLTVVGYQAAGGVKGAIAQSAEALYAETLPEDRPTLRELMLRLVVPGPEGEPVRARVSRRTVASRPVHDALLDRLVAARLVTSDDGVLMLAHEAVVRSWPRLQGWIEDDVEGLQILHHLSAAADAWQSLGRPDSELYRGVRLDRALAWQERTAAGLTDVEREFLDAGKAAAASAARATGELARARGLMVRRLRAALIGAALLLLVAVGAGLVAVNQGERAIDAAKAAQARQLSSDALRSRDLALGALLAVAAVRLEDSSQSRSTLSTFLSAHPGLLATSERIGPVVGLRLSPDGRTLAAYDTDNVVSEVDVESGEVLAAYDTDGPGRNLQFWTTTPTAFSPDGAQLAVGTQTFTTAPVVLLDTSTWRPEPVQPTGFPTAAAKTMSVSYSADGRYLAAALALPAEGAVGGAVSEDARQLALVWDLRHLPRPVRSFRLQRSGNFDYFQQIFLDHHGRVLYGSAPLTAYRVDPAPGQPRVAWRAKGISSSAVADLSPDGSRLDLLAGQAHPGRVVAVDTSSGRVKARVDLEEALESLDFAPDGSTVVGAGGDELFVLDPVTLSERSKVPTQHSLAVQVTEDGSDALTTFGEEGTVITWDLRGDRSYLRPLPVEANAATTGFGFRISSPDGRRVAIFAGSFGIADLETGRASRTFHHDFGFFTPGAWRPDSGRFALGSTKGTVALLDDGARVVRRAQVADAMVSGLDYAADGSRLAVSDVDGIVRLLDAETLSPVGKPVDFPGYVADLTLAPDGRHAFVVSAPTDFRPGELSTFDTWAVVDLTTGTRTASGDLPEPDIGYADFAPDGQHVALGLSSGRMEILDTRTGAFAGGAPPASHGGTQYWVAYTPRGDEVITSDAERDVTLWDAVTGRVEASIRGYGAAAQLRSGTHEVWIFGVGTGVAWDPRLKRAIDYGCAMAGRDLTAEEWATYVGDGDPQQVCPG
jgi:WD40 repeat protein